MMGPIGQLSAEAFGEIFRDAMRYRAGQSRAVRLVCDRCPPWETPCRVGCEHARPVEATSDTE